MPERHGLITTAELAAILDQPDLRFFDCTTYLEYQPAGSDIPYIAVPGRHSFEAGHIPGATHLYWMDNLVSRENPVLRPVEELRAIYLKAGVAGGTSVVTYCRTGMQSSYDYFVTKYLGYDAKMYDASFIEWSWEELPVESSVKH